MNELDKLLTELDELMEMYLTMRNNDLAEQRYTVERKIEKSYALAKQLKEDLT